MGWLSDLFSGGSSSSSSSSSSSNDDGPSAGPTPTVIKTGTTLKTGTVLNNDDDPVVFTPNDDGGFTGQNQSTLPAATTTDDDKSFGEVFSENRAAGEDTFVYKGEVYTTDLAPDTPATPSVSYDAFGNAYDTPEAAAQADQVAEAQAAAAQNAITAASNAALDPRGDQIQSPTSNGAGIASLGEDDVMAQEVVGAAGQDYADSLPDFSYDFTAGDDDGSALPDSSQVAGGGWEEYFNNASTQDILNTAGSNVQLPATPQKYYDAFGNEFSTPDAAGESDRAAEAAAAAAIAAPQNPFVDDLLDALAGRDRISQMLLPESAPGYFANLGVGLATGVETAVRGAADLLDARPTTNLTLERMRDVGPMNAAQEEFMINAAGEEGQRIRQEALGPRDQFFYDKTAGLTSAVDYMKDYYDKNIKNYEGNENIYKNIKSYEEAAGYEPGQVDPKLLDAMQSEQGIVDSLLFGQGPGSAVRMDGSGFDPSTATQKGIEAFGTTTPGLATAMMGPAGFVAGTTYGFTQVKGELDKDTGAGIDAFYASGRLQQSPAFKSLVADGVSEADAVKTLKQRARDESAAFAGVLGGGATALEAGLLRTGAPGMLATPVIEALQEGPGESLASNQILGSVLGFDTPLNRAEILENMTAGGLGGGGASAVAPLAGGSTQAAPVLDPSQFPGSGQPAQSTVQSSYDQTPAEQLMFGDSGMSGVGDITADARIMASEMLADQQIVFDADNNILTNKETNESFQIDPKVTPILEATTEIILGGTPPGARAVPTPTSAQTTVEELATPGQDGRLGISFQGRRDLDAAKAKKLKEGSVVKRADGSLGPATTPVSLPTLAEGIAPNVDTTSVGAASINERKPAGIETALTEKKIEDTAAADPTLPKTTPEEAAEIVEIAEDQGIDTNDAAVIKNLITVYHATSGAPFSAVDQSIMEKATGYNSAASGPGFYGSTSPSYPSEYVGGQGSLMRTQVDTSTMLDAANGTPLTSAQADGVVEALSKRKDGQGNDVQVSREGDTLNLTYETRDFADGSKTETETVNLNIPQDVFDTLKTFSEQTKNPLAKDERGLSLESNQSGDTQNLRDILVDSGFTGTTGISDVNGGGSENVVVFDPSTLSELETVIDQGPIPTTVEELPVTVSVEKAADNAAPGTGSLDAAANTSLSTIRTRVAVGDSLEGYSAADVSGQPIGSSTPQDDLDVRGTTGGPFTNMKNEPIGSIDNAPYGEPVRRVIDNSDGTTTIQVGSRVSAEGAAGNRDNYVSTAVTLPASATDEQKAAAYREAEANWRSNYEGATTSGDIKRNAGKVLPNEDITTFKAIDNKMDADNAATEVKLPVAEETAAVVTEKADGSAEVKLSDGSTSKTVVEKDGDSKTTRKSDASVTETDTGATVEFDQTAAEQAAAEQAALDQDVFAADQVEQEAAATAAEQAAAEQAAAAETQTASTVAVSQVTDDGEDEEEVEVEVEDEVQEPGGDVTVDVDEDDTFVPVITTTDENGDTITECPEGYTMVEGPDGPMCQKSVTTTVRRQRAGAGTRAYTGLSGNRGRVSPGQRSRSNTTTTTETVDPTTRSA